MRVYSDPTAHPDSPMKVERSPEEKRFTLVLIGCSAVAIVALVVAIWSAAS